MTCAIDKVRDRRKKTMEVILVDCEIHIINTSI